MCVVGAGPAGLQQLASKKKPKKWMVLHLRKRGPGWDLFLQLGDFLPPQCTVGALAGCFLKRTVNTRMVGQPPKITNLYWKFVFLFFAMVLAIEDIQHLHI